MEENNNSSEDLEKITDTYNEKNNIDKQRQPSEDFLNYAMAWRAGAITHRNRVIRSHYSK